MREKHCYTVQGKFTTEFQRAEGTAAEPHHRSVIFWLTRDCPYVRRSVRQYCRSSPYDHFRKRPALVTTTFVKPRLNCDLNFAM